MITHINKVFKMQLKRNTAQKNVIMEELLAADHPTATELYGRIHQSHPKISRATVFRVLADFSACGKARKLEFAGSEARYDGGTVPHAHCRCYRCGREEDVISDSLIPLLTAESVGGFKVTSAELVFGGLCRECASADEAEEL